MRGRHLSAGLAQLRSDDDAVALFELTDEALYQAKEAGKGQCIPPTASASRRAELVI